MSRKPMDTSTYFICVLLVILSLPILIYFYFILSFSIAGNIEHTLITSSSPDKSYEIMVRYFDPFPSGDHTIHVYYRNKNSSKKHKLFTTEIANKGTTLDEDNCRISWNNQVATIKFKGLRRFPETYIVDITKTKKYEKLE